MSASVIPLKKQLCAFQLMAVIFLIISGGLYGLKPLLSYAGENGALLLLIILLRKKRTVVNHPFKIKLNIAGLCLMTLIPFSVYLIALAGAFIEEETFSAAAFAVGGFLSAEIIWQIITFFKPALKTVTIKTNE